MTELQALQNSLRTIDKHMTTRGYATSATKALWIDARVTTLAAISALTDTDTTYSGANITIEFPDNTDVASFPDVDSEASLERFRTIIHSMALKYFGVNAYISVYASSKYRVCVNDSYNVVKLADMVRDWCQSINDTGNWIVNKATNNV
jgi:hypothetical protein